jgi:hypothetical protein
MGRLKQFLGLHPAQCDCLIFHSKCGAPLLQATILSQGPHAVLQALKLKRKRKPGTVWTS